MLTISNHVNRRVILLAMVWCSVLAFDYYVTSPRRPLNFYEMKQIPKSRFDSRSHIGEPSWAKEYQRLEAARKRLSAYQRRDQLFRRNYNFHAPTGMAQRRTAVTNKNFFKVPYTQNWPEYGVQQRSYYYQPLPGSYRMNEVKRTFQTPSNLRLTNNQRYATFDRYGGKKSAVIPSPEIKLERKIQMLQHIKKAIIEKHKLNRESELVKKEMMDWAQKFMKPKKQHVKSKIVSVQRKANVSYVKPKPAQNSKKTIVPHVQETKSGWKRHHIFHQTSGSSMIEPHDKTWEYKKFHIYHKTLPVNKFVQSKRVIVPYSDEFGINADDDDEDMDDDDGDDTTDDATAPIFSDDDQDEDDDLPNITAAKQLKKVPLLNIETPNMKEVPESARNQLEHSPLPEYKIDKGLVSSPADLREAIDDEYTATKPKSGEVDKKSLLNDENMLEDFMRGDLNGNNVINNNKDKMNPEELEAIKEDQDASKMMKVQEKNKFDEQPEVLGLGKKGLSATNKESISASFSNGAVADPSLIGREGVDSSVDFSKTMKPDETSMHHEHRPQLNVPEDADASKRKSENAVDKQIIDGDNDEHHPMNELDSFQGQSRRLTNDYESYDNTQTPEVMDQNDEDRDSTYLKPVDTNHGNTIVEDTIKKLQDHDEMESDKLVKKFASGFQQHPLEENNRASDALTTSDDAHDAPPSPETGFDEVQQDDHSDLLDPMKAQERAIHLSEAAEIANKLHGAGKDQSNTFVKNQYPSTADIADSLLKSNPHATSVGLSPNRFASLSSKFDSLSPEDALHALNGKAALNDILAKNTNDEGPPDAVVNAIQSPNPLANNLVKTTKERLEKKKDDEVSAIKANEQKNSTTANIAISDIENATVAKEVVSILESLGQVKNSIQAEKFNTTNESVPAKPVVAVDTASNASTDASTESKSKVTTNNVTQDVDVNTNGTSLEDHEERETKEAVRDLNIAIGILEKKLSIINEAKKSGNKKAIYIVDQTLRNSKGVAKSNITRIHDSRHHSRRRHHRRRRRRHHHRRHRRKNSKHFDEKRASKEKKHSKKKKLHSWRRRHLKKTSET